MPASLSIGDFSRATHLSVKMLRHYHQLGLLEPSDVDTDTGYRRYTTDQIPAAQVIRRFRDLDMPLDQIRAVLVAPDLSARNRLISAHLRQLQEDLTRTQTAVASLQALLTDPADVAPVSHRSVGAVTTAAISAAVAVSDLLPWYLGALGELTATLAARGIAAAGAPGGVFATELFSEETGQATVFVPTTTEPPPLGRVAPRVIPAAELAVIIHVGSHADVDRSYGALATYVADHALRVDGPIREYYLVGRQDTPDESAWRTEICWPIFSTGARR
ncbi:MAG TPA: MerR family transcriptional regulator [Trebonia sp.]|nr:MerR family transcriptional regulator [Trebonia sp.]